MGWGCLVTQRCSPGHPSTGRPGRRLPAPFIAGGVGLQSVNRDRVQISYGSAGWLRRCGLVRARRCDGGWRLRALLKAGLCPQGDDAGATALHLVCSSSGKRDAGVSLAAGAESTQQSTARPGGSGRGVVASSLVVAQCAAFVATEHVHLSNNPLKLTVRGRSTPESRSRSRTAA